MKTTSTVARYLLGLLFLVFGLNGFLNFIKMPPPSGIAGQFVGALYVSHGLGLIMAIEVICGVLLLTNRYVPLALVVLGAVIANIVFLHAFMAPAGLPIALVAAILWVGTFLNERDAFSSIFRARTPDAQAV